MCASLSEKKLKLDCLLSCVKMALRDMSFFLPPPFPCCPIIWSPFLIFHSPILTIQRHTKSFSSLITAYMKREWPVWPVSRPVFLFLFAKHRKEANRQNLSRLCKVRVLWTCRSFSPRSSTSVLLPCTFPFHESCIVLSSHSPVMSVLACTVADCKWSLSVSSEMTTWVHLQSLDLPFLIIIYK